MAVVTRTVKVLVCDICGKQSLPESFSSIMLGEFMNVCDGCKSILVRDVEALKKQYSAKAG
jgi:ribosome-binding protein aMBF1 (putative translation factor)